MNKEQAQRALEVGAKALKENNYEKAIRFLTKSLSMDETATARKLLAQAKADAANPPQANGPGLRQRATAKSTPREPVKQQDTRPYTAAQANDVRRIKGCKDFYVMLGVPRDSTEAVIKKGYRKMAIKLHPDKNSAPGADEAFKEVSRAYGILSDPQQRAAYDQYGDTSDNPSQQYTRHYRNDIDPADLFREVFGAGFPGGGGHFQTFHFGGGHRRTAGMHRARTQQPNERGSLLQLLPLLLLFFMSFASFPNQSESLFSFSKDSSHPVERHTMSQGIIPDITFFVDKSFKAKYGRNSRSLLSVESQVQTQYIYFVENKCRSEKNTRNRQVEFARKRRDKVNQAKLLEKQLKWCDELDRLNTYIRG